jgi:hypothetical protein
VGIYMTPAQITARAEEVSVEFQKLLLNKRVVMRHGSKQWAFLRHCFSALLSGTASDYPCTKAQALQYRFEVEDRLSRYYLSPGRPLPFIFRLIHIDRALSLDLIDVTYPCTNGYVLLVTEDQAGAGRHDRQETNEILERSVTEAADAEWAVYGKLPEVDLVPLDRSFLVGGPAYKRIQHLAERHRERRWTLAQPENNPSTKRVLDIKVVRVEDQRAFIRTKEYWYLRWWDLGKGDYAKVDYRETNVQTYILVPSGGKWVVQENIYPPPRNSAPTRRRIIVG